METIEAAPVFHQARPLLLEDIPDRSLRKFGMPVGAGMGDALVQQPGVQLLIAVHPQPGREEALPHQPHLVLDLPLLPA